MGAFAGAAQAQSSVTVYGIIDIGYIGGNEKATVAGADSARTVNQIGSSAQSSSRLGFRGNEDLGGGTSAFFTIEVDVTPTNADALSNFGSASNRQSFVGVAQKGIGRASVGTQYTLIHPAVVATDAAGANNVIGNVIYPRNSGLGGYNSNPNGSSIGYTLRQNNTVIFNSDKFSGFGVNLYYNMNNSNDNQASSSVTTYTPNGANSNAVSTSTVTTGGTNNTTGYGISADYTWKKLYATVAYQSFKQETDATVTALTAATARTASVATNTTDNQWYVGATYDFGILKAYAQYLNRKVTSNTNSNQYLSRTAQQIGVRANLTKQIEGWASAGMGRYQAFGLGEPTANFTGYQLGSNYWLSKRTNLYAIFGANQTSNASSVAGRPNDYNGNNYAVGVRHTF